MQFTLLNVYLGHLIFAVLLSRRSSRETKVRSSGLEPSLPLQCGGPHHQHQCPLQLLRK